MNETPLPVELDQAALSLVKDAMRQGAHRIELKRRGGEGQDCPEYSVYRVDYLGPAGKKVGRKSA